jgi:predicted MFS family arabinose efflux permease
MESVMDNRIFWLAVGSFTISTEGFVVSTLLPAIASDAHITVATAGLLITAFAFAYALGGPVLATLTGTWDRRWIIVSTMILFVIGNLVAAASSSFEILLFARVLMALAAGLFAATAQATAVSLVDEHHRARAIAVVVGGTTVAVALGAPVGALIAMQFGWRGTFLAIALLGGLAALVLAWRLPRGLVGSRLPMRDRLEAALAPGMPAMLGVTLLCLTGAFIVLSYIAPLAMRGAGLGEDVLPAMLLAFGVGAVIGNYAGGQLADRIGALRTVLLSLFGNALVLLSLSLIPALLPDRIAGPLLIAAMIPWGIIGWSFMPGQVSRIVAHAPGATAVVLSLNGSALYLGVALGSLIGSEVLRVGVPADLGWIGALFPLASALIVLASRQRRRPVAVGTAPAE